MESPDEKEKKSAELQGGPVKPAAAPEPEWPDDAEGPAPKSAVKKPGMMKKPAVIILAVLIVVGFIVGFFVGTAYKRTHTETFTGQVTAEKLNKLDKYTNLKTADFSGSTCYDEIMAFIAAHPDVAVTYTVELDGQTVPGDTAELNLDSISAASALEKAAYLPNVTRISAGTLSCDDAAALAAAFPNAELSAEVTSGSLTLDTNVEKYDFSKLTVSEAADAAKLISLMPGLKTIVLTNGSSSVDFDVYKALYDARPDVTYDYTFELYGQTLTPAVDTLKFKKVSIGDDGLQQIRGMLPYLPSLTYLSFDRCDVSDDAVVQLRDDFPAIKIAWRIYFGEYSCMTDVEKIWAIGTVSDEQTEPLKYCTDVKYLDLGHNVITKIDFVRYMPNLEVLIIACGGVDDLSPLEGCTTLEYLEITLSQVKDLSPLASCVNLKHLEMSQDPQITDITPLYGLDLVRFYAMYNGIPAEQQQKFQELHPDCLVNFGASSKQDPFFESDWRYSYDTGTYVPRYALLRQQIGYDDDYGQSKLYTFLEDDD